MARPEFRPDFRMVPIGRGHGDRRGRVGVIDIGSNSIRLVVYDRLSRSPVPIFNEKVMCGLGRDLALTGRLYPDGVISALDNLARFTRLLQGMNVDRVDVLGTAAVRDALDGEAFVAEVHRRCGLAVAVISGAEEARLSALGVLSGIPDADGVMGDLGGGSLELVGIDRGTIVEQETLPLGPFRLMGAAGGKGGARAAVWAALASQIWLPRYRGRTFYPVGGAWRTLARIEMNRRRHPLKVIQNYVVPTEDIADIAGVIARQGKSSLERWPEVTRRRAETLPYAGLVLEGVLEALRPGQVAFSANGLREGHLFDLLSPEERAEDPLLYAAADLARRMDRFGDVKPIADWTEGLFDGEDQPAARLRRAACLLSDICWTEHPDYRGEHALLRVLRLPIMGIEHAERGLVAATLYVRYGGNLGDREAEPARVLLSDAEVERATRLGLILRLAHTLTGGAAGLLERTRLEIVPGAVVLTLPEDSRALNGEVVQRRLDALAKALDRPGRILVDAEIQDTDRKAVTGT